MKKLLAGLLFMFALAVGAPAQTEPPSTPITVGTVTDAGPAFYMHPYLYSVPITIGANTGTMIFYPQQCNASDVCGFILFRSPLQGPNYVTAYVRSWIANTFNSVGWVTSATVTYTVLADPNNDNDSDAVSGTFTMNFAYFFTGYGRGRGWHESITGGSGAQLITQD